MADTVVDERPLHERPEIHQRRWFILGVMCTCLVMVVMAVSGLNVALPSIQQDLGAGQTDLQWIIDSYAIVFAGLLLSAGAIGDRFGRKLALMGGLAIFAGGSLVGALADTTSLVIASRAIAGIGAAFVMPATLSLITVVFPPEERGKAIAIWAGFAGAGGALGPLIVGFLLTGWWIFPSFWWGSAFVINVVTSLIVLGIIATFAPRSKDDKATPLDPAGAALSLVGISALLFGIIEGPERGWTDGLVVGGFVVGAALLLAFLWWERRAEHPMLPLEYFRNRRFSTGTGIITFGFMVMFGFFFLITMYFQFVKGYSPLRAGVASLPFPITMILVSPRSDGFVQRFGLNAVVTTGFASMTTGFALLALISADTSYWILVLPFVLLAAGMAVSIAPATGAIMSAVPLNKAGVGSAVNDTTREFGGALGIAVLGSIVTAQYRNHFDTGGLPDEVAEVAGESIGGAVGVGRRMGGPQGAGLIEQAGDAFTNATNVAFGAAAIIAALTGVAVYAAGASARRRPVAESLPEIQPNPASNPGEPGGVAAEAPG